MLHCYPAIIAVAFVIVILDLCNKVQVYTHFWCIAYPYAYRPSINIVILCDASTVSLDYYYYRNLPSGPEIDIMHEWSMVCSYKVRRVVYNGMINFYRWVVSNTMFPFTESRMHLAAFEPWSVLVTAFGSVQRIILPLFMFHPSITFT